MGFSRQEYWSGLPFTSLRDLSNPRFEPRSPTLQADSLLSEPPGNHLVYITILLNFKYAPLICSALKEKTTINLPFKKIPYLKNFLLFFNIFLILLLLCFYFIILYCFCNISACISHGCTHN